MTARRYLFGILLALVLPVALVLGQAPPTPTHTAAPLTELEALRVENVRLEGIILQRQINDWEEKRKKLRADIESIRQGWLWNPENGAFNPKDTAKQNH